MPRLIDPGDGDAITLDDLVEFVETAHFDPQDEDSFAALGPALARLGRNPDFLAELALAELKDRCRSQCAHNSYGPQVFLLRPPGRTAVLRANFWPSRQDAVTRASGPGAFFYGLPHDHNFAFLTHGYFGPGYWSDYYEYDRGRLAGLPGEAAGLTFAGRQRLEPGRVMLYRMSRDIHAQLPPDSFSVSLNILARDARQRWIDQYRFDLETGCIAEGLTLAASEALLTIAVQFGCGLDLAHDFAAGHPADRMRVTALAALAAAAKDDAARVALLAPATGSPRVHVAGHARAMIAAIEQGQTPPP